MKKHLFSLISWTVLSLLPTIVAAQWVQTSGPTVTVQSLAVVGTNLFAGTNNGVFRSTNNGSNWTQVNSGLADTGISSLAVVGSNLFAGTSSGVFLTTNNGTAWNQVNNGLTVTSITKLAVVGTNIFGATRGGGVFLSTNNGTSWTSADGSVFQNAFMALLSSAGTSLFASSTSDNVIYRSTDNGADWTPADSGLSTANVIVQCGSNLVAGGVTGVYLSTNNAGSWSQLTTAWGLQSTQPTGFVTKGTTVYGVTYAAVLVGANNGTNWSEITPPLSLNDPLTAIAVLDTNLFIGTNNNSDFTKGATVWRLSLNNLPTGVSNTENTTPVSFGLEQNYPNPFNPTTVIQYQLPASGQVSLKVYNMLGQTVATLVDARENAGAHSVTFDGNNLASGVYFYRLQAGGFSDVKKLLLTK